MVDKKDSWADLMLSRGYSRGHTFPSYEALSVWDSNNKRAHIRKKFGETYHVFFTDGQPCSSSSPKPMTSLSKTPVQKKKFKGRATSVKKDDDWMKDIPF